MLQEALHLELAGVMLDAHVHCFEIEKFDNLWLDTTKEKLDRVLNKNAAAFFDLDPNS